MQARQVRQKCHSTLSKPTSSHTPHPHPVSPPPRDPITVNEAGLVGLWRWGRGSVYSLYLGILGHFESDLEIWDRGLPIACLNVKERDITMHLRTDHLTFMRTGRKMPSGLDFVFFLNANLSFYFAFLQNVQKHLCTCHLKLRSPRDQG